MIIQIIKYFQLHYSDLVKSMKDSNHHLDNKNLNPYHLEGDVWTHTMMVLNYAIINNFSLEVKLAALLHDIGKPKARFIKDEKKVTFFNHENISTVLAVKILNDFEKHFNLSFNKTMVLELINHHSDLHRIGYFDDNKTFFLSQKNRMFLDNKYTNYEYYINMVHLNMSDNYGRFYDIADKEAMKNKYNFLLSFIPNKKYKQDKSNFPKAIMLSGLPGVGKSYIKDQLLKDDNYVVLSSDSKIMARYPKLSYKDAYYTVIDKDEFKDIEKELREELKEAVKDRKNIIFDRTNLSKKVRNRWFCNVPFKYYNKINYFVVADYDIILNRNNKRKEKTIKNDVYDFMINYFKLTGYNEEFDEIKIIFN